MCHAEHALAWHHQPLPHPPTIVLSTIYSGYFEVAVANRLFITRLAPSKIVTKPRLSCKAWLTVTHCITPPQAVRAPMLERTTAKCECTTCSPMHVYCSCHVFRMAECTACAACQAAGSSPSPLFSNAEQTEPLQTSRLLISCLVPSFHSFQGGLHRGESGHGHTAIRACRLLRICRQQVGSARVLHGSMCSVCTGLSVFCRGLADLALHTWYLVYCTTAVQCIVNRSTEVKVYTLACMRLGKTLMNCSSGPAIIK